MSDENLHPNLARMAAAYDQIIEQLDAGMITATQARSRIDQLEAKDDQGTRWSIDPESGDFVRRTAFGELEFGTPPAFGVASLDAFTISDPDRDDNPALRLDTQQVSTFTSPAGMMGATRMVIPDEQDLPDAEGSSSTLMAKVAAVPVWAKAAAGAVAVVLIAGGAWAFTGGSGSSSTTPNPSASSTPQPSASASAKDKEKGKGKGKGKGKKPKPSASQ